MLVHDVHGLAPCLGQGVIDHIVDVGHVKSPTPDGHQRRMLRKDEIAARTNRRCLLINDLEGWVSHPGAGPSWREREQLLQPHRLPQCHRDESGVDREPEDQLAVPEDDEQQRREGGGARVRTGHELARPGTPHVLSATRENPRTVAVSKMSATG